MGAGALSQTHIVCIQGHASAPTRMSIWEQQLYQCSSYVLFDINGTADTRMHRKPVHPLQAKHGPNTGVRISMAM